MRCNFPECDSCNPEEYCEEHGVHHRGPCIYCQEDEEAKVVHDFDPSGEGHPLSCMCPCCDLEEEE